MYVKLVIVNNLNIQCIVRRASITDDVDVHVVTSFLHI